jgi:DnaJ-class molecular chaperone
LASPARDVFLRRSVKYPQVADGIAREKREGSRRHEQRKETSASSADFPGYLAHPLRVLGIRWPCHIEDVKAAFRSRAKQTHPDLHPELKGRAEEFRAVSDAYQEVLAALAG